MSKYRVGGKVRIKNRKWYNSLKSLNGIINGAIIAFGFNTDMAKQCGKIGIITNIFDTSYRGKIVKKYFLNIDGGEWSWSEDMFEPNNNILEIE